MELLHSIIFSKKTKISLIVLEFIFFLTFLLIAILGIKPNEQTDIISRYSVFFLQNFYFLIEWNNDKAEFVFNFVLTFHLSLVLFLSFIISLINIFYKKIDGDSFIRFCLSIGGLLLLISILIKLGVYDGKLNKWKAVLGIVVFALFTTYHLLSFICFHKFENNTFKYYLLSFLISFSIWYLSDIIGYLLIVKYQIHNGFDFFNILSVPLFSILLFIVSPWNNHSFAFGVYCSAPVFTVVMVFLEFITIAIVFLAKFIKNKKQAKSKQSD